jgi:hypothetical protein
MAEADDPFQHTRMSLGEHLRELRGRLVKSAIALVVALMVTFTFYDPIFEFLARPMNTVLEEVDRDQRGTGSSTHGAAHEARSTTCEQRAEADYYPATYVDGRLRDHSVMMRSLRQLALRCR